MPYQFNFGDNSTAVTSGASTTIVFARVIQADDGYGGYNTSFSLVNSSSYYHVHFGAGGTRVKVVRYFSSSSQQGNNVTVHQSGTTKTFSELAHLCGAEYPNHAALFQHFRAAIANVRRNRAGALEG